MKVLSSATLLAILIKCAATSEIDKTNVCDAIDKHDYDGYGIQCLFDSSLHLEGIKHVAEKRSPKSIIAFIKRMRPPTSYTLTAIYTKGTLEKIKQVHKSTHFSQSELVKAALKSKLMYIPENYVDLLNRIDSEDDQELAVVKGIKRLFRRNRADRVIPLLAAMEGVTFRNENLMEIAILEAFQEGALHCHGVATDICSHPAITPEVYASGLIDSGRFDANDPVFKGLLDKADEDDLGEVLNKRGYDKLSENFRTAIEKELSKAKPGGTRTGRVAEQVQIVKETLDKVTESIGDIPDERAIEG